MGKNKEEVQTSFHDYYVERQMTRNKLKDILNQKVPGAQIVNLGHVLQIIYADGSRFTCNGFNIDDLKLLKEGRTIQDVCEK